jgi:excisionase family DNA binding protein
MAFKLKAQPTAQVTVPATIEILTGEEVAGRLKINPRTVYELTRSRCRHPLPAHRTGKTLRFNWPEVVAWFLESGRKTA